MQERFHKFVGKVIKLWERFYWREKVGKVSKLQESWKGEEMKGKGKLLVPPEIEKLYTLTSNQN